MVEGLTARTVPDEVELSGWVSAFTLGQSRRHRWLEVCRVRRQLLGNELTQQFRVEGFRFRV